MASRHERGVYSVHSTDIAASVHIVFRKHVSFFKSKILERKLFKFPVESIRVSFKAIDCFVVRALLFGRNQLITVCDSEYGQQETHKFGE